MHIDIQRHGHVPLASAHNTWAAMALKQVLEYAMYSLEAQVSPLSPPNHRPGQDWSCRHGMEVEAVTFNHLGAAFSLVIHGHC